MKAYVPEKEKVTTTVVDEETLESMMNGDISRENLESIIQMAINNGSQDDLSIMVLEK